MEKRIDQVTIIWLKWMSDSRTSVVSKTFGYEEEWDKKTKQMKNASNEE